LHQVTNSDPIGKTKQRKKRVLEYDDDDDDDIENTPLLKKTIYSIKR
jgi:hypothetical protein